ncbi:hypothetical protein [Stackebrandtia nassauensis]|uniref:Integrin alpha beta-propellor repeat protein n=1 Tax=Stackebrandtia nassauensis (strain DSM 44728 / CIP 108903 / NRRL B-16338 / NBRC 102104 / LLR-40K-21) TaxID=446470 RepID=D3Q909_STANL|nr:hypothetical protein [Stackebrandtia nassauensis]ADD40618.1 Integrin alpha beta-propellor repeat protein [Stackebrandtia nassauensis DSM 44728]
MPTKHRKRLYVSILLAAVPLAVAGVAIPALAGDFVADPVHDFDCDDQRDAVQPTSYKNVDGHDGAGSITVQYSTDDEIVELTQATPGIAGTPEHDDSFGDKYTSFDENGDGCDDLVVSAPWEDVTENGTESYGAGMIWIIPGSPEGLRPNQSRAINLATPGVPGAVAQYQHFGDALAAGDTADGQPFLVVGAPGAKVGSTKSGAGALYYLRDDYTYRITQDSPGIPGKAESNDYFGEYLSVTDRYIAVSASGETINGAPDAGMVHVLNHRLSNGALGSVDAFHQDTPGVSGTAEEKDELGEEGLSVVNYQAAPGKPVSALVGVGSPGERLGSSHNWHGMAHLIRTSGSGDRQQLTSVHQDSPGVEGIAEGADHFGSEVVVATEGGTGTPSTTHWAVAALETGFQTEPDDGFDRPQVHVFDVSATPGDTDKLIKPDDYGIPLSKEEDLETLTASAEYLYVETPGDVPGSDEQAYPDTVYGVPWENILNGQNLPVVQHRVTPWP